MFVLSSYWGLIGVLYSFTHGMRGFYQAMTDFEVLFQYNKIENEVKELPDAKNHKIVKGVIEFKNIDFSYDKKRKNFNRW